MPRKSLIALFLGIISAILLLGNIAIYHGLIFAFPSGIFPVRPALGILLGIFSASFILASFLGMRFHSKLVSLYYTLSAAWLGALGYLFFASALTGIAAALSVSVFPDLPAALIGKLSFLLALLASAYGLLHARRIVMKEITLELPDLPAAWEGKKLVVMSDLHLGQVHSAGLVKRAVSAARSLDPYAAVIVGDLFDGWEMPEMEKLLAPFSGIAAPLGTYFVTGNHEEFSDRNRFLDAIASAGIRILRDELVSLEGLQLAGVSHHSGADKEAFRAVLSALPLDPALPSVLLKHEPNHLDAAEAAGISLQISGHTHGGQQWPFGAIAGRVYGGYSRGLRYFRSLAVFVTTGAGTWGPPLRVGTDCEIVALRFVRRK